MCAHLTTVHILRRDSLSAPIDYEHVKHMWVQNGWQRHGTCSAHICTACTTALPGDKDACPEHKAACLEACARAGIQLPMPV